MFSRSAETVRCCVFVCTTPESSPHKTMTQVFSDCLECVRRSEQGPVGKAAMILTDLPKQIATQTARTFRMGVLAELLERTRSQGLTSEDLNDFFAEL